MTFETAKIIFYIGIVAGLFLWFINTIIMFKFLYAKKKKKSVSEHYPIEKSVITRKIIVKEKLKSARERIFSLLKNSFPFFTFTLKEELTDRIFVYLSSRSAGNYPVSVYLQSTSRDATCVLYSIDIEKEKKKWFYIVLGFQFFALISILVIDFLIWKFALNSSNPNQVLQTFHQIHFLWPFYLFLFVFKLRVNQVCNIIEFFITGKTVPGMLGWKNF